MRAWNDYLRALEQELGVDNINRWARTLKVINYDAANLYLEAQDSFQAQWIQEYLLPQARNHLRNENNRLVKIHLQVAQKKPLAKSDLEAPSDTPQSPFITDPIDPAYTFESFVETSQNKMIYKLFLNLKQAAQDPPSYNPIYLFGVEGIGKTHLLQAYAQTLKKLNLRVNYVKLPTFTQNMVMAIKSEQMANFRKFYRECDVLIVDDVHHLANKNATQEEFFHTFNTLHITGKQIVLSSHSSPQQLKNIEPRLISRFEWGIVLPMHPPSQTEFKKILNKKLEEVHLSLNSDSKDFMLKTFSKNPQILSSALSALILRAHLKLPQGKLMDPRELTPTAIEHLLSDLIKKEKEATITPDYIIDHIAHYFGVKMEDVLGKSQSRECVLPRQMSMYFCREHLKLPYMKIGDIFSRDHSTVMSSVKQIQKNSREPNHSTSQIITALKQAIFPYNKQ